MSAPVVFCVGAAVAFVACLTAMYCIDPAVGLGLYVVLGAVTVALTVRAARAPTPK